MQNFKKFYKGDENHEDEEHGGQPPKLTKTSWGLSLKLILLKLHKFPKNSTSTILQLFLIWNKLERWKRWKSKWVPHGLTENQKNLSLWSVVVLILYNNELFLDQIVIWDKKWILYENWRQPAKWSDREETPKNFPKQMCTKKKIMVTGVLLLVWPLQLSESQWNHFIWEVCSANRGDATVALAASTGQQKGPNFYAWQCLPTHRTTDASKVESTGPQGFILCLYLPYSPDYQLTTSSSSILTTS